jgi:phage N-6-adenine-methyltransferase
MSKAVTLVAEDYGRGLPAHYAPTEGLKNMAVAEAAAIYYRRAKDPAGLFAAVEVLLGEKRRFVLWWEGQATQPVGRPPKNGNGPVTVFPKPEDFGLDKMTLSRWRQRYKDDDTYKQALEAAQERCRRVCEAERGATDQRGASGTGENEWHTPAEHVEAVRAALGGIDLDPASTAAAQATVRAARFFTKEEDGLAQEWHGRVFLNPPYSQPLIDDFSKKMVGEFKSGRVKAAIMLTHNYTSSKWFQDAAAVASAIAFPRDRVKFLSPTGEKAQPTQGQAFFYFGEDVDRFFAEFSPFGFVVEVLENG